MVLTPDVRHGWPVAVTMTHSMGFLKAADTIPIGVVHCLALIRHRRIPHWYTTFRILFPDAGRDLS